MIFIKPYFIAFGTIDIIEFAISYGTLCNTIIVLRLQIRTNNSIKRILIFWYEFVAEEQNDA